MALQELAHWEMQNKAADRMPTSIAPAGSLTQAVTLFGFAVRT